MKKLLLPIKKVYWFFKHYYKLYLSHYNRKKYADILFRDQFGRNIDWENPRDLNEKIQWLAYCTDTSLWTLCADKYRMREFIKSENCEELLVPLYGHWDKAADIDFDSLPNKFVLKPNHGYGDVIIVKDKNRINKNAVCNQLQKSIDTSWGRETGEFHYLGIKPCIIAEMLLEPDSANGLVDYKVWCFNGKPYYIFTGSNRDVITHKVVFNLFTTSWERLDSFMSEPYRNDVPVQKPTQLAKMLKYAEKLSTKFPEVRVDFYEIKGKLYIGELTFTSNMGRMDFHTQKALIEMGNNLNIKQIKCIQ